MSWSSAVSLSPLLGETVVEDTTMLQCNITGLSSVSSAWIETMCFSALARCSTMLPECHLNINLVCVLMCANSANCYPAAHRIIFLSSKSTKLLICCVSVTPRIVQNLNINWCDAFGHITHSFQVKTVHYVWTKEETGCILNVIKEKTNHIWQQLLTSKRKL